MAIRLSFTSCILILLVSCSSQRVSNVIAVDDPIASFNSNIVIFVQELQGHMFTEVEFEAEYN